MMVVHYFVKRKGIEMSKFWRAKTIYLLFPFSLRLPVTLNTNNNSFIIKFLTIQLNSLLFLLLMIK